MRFEVRVVGIGENFCYWMPKGKSYCFTPWPVVAVRRSGGGRVFEMVLVNMSTAAGLISKSGPKCNFGILLEYRLVTIYWK